MEAIIQQASSFAADVDFIIMLIAVLTGFWLIVVEVAIFSFLFRFRKRDGQKAQYYTGETEREKKWISTPHLLIFLCDVVILAVAVNVWYTVKQDLPKADERIRVVGHQWSWRFVHPGMDKKLGTADDVETVDELHLKVNTTYHFKLESEDVMHSFSIPVFRLKQDAVPGRVITGWFKPVKTGEFDVQCAEMCGIGHGIMGGRVIVETEEDHRWWLESKTNKQT